MKTKVYYCCCIFLLSITSCLIGDIPDSIRFVDETIICADWRLKKVLVLVESGVTRLEISLIARHGNDEIKVFSRRDYGTDDYFSFSTRSDLLSLKDSMSDEHNKKDSCVHLFVYDENNIKTYLYLSKDHPSSKLLEAELISDFYRFMEEFSTRVSGAVKGPDS